MLVGLVSSNQACPERPLPPKIGVIVSGQLTGSLTVGSFSQHSPILNLVPVSINYDPGPRSVGRGSC